MTRRTKTFRLAAVAATSALVLAACGGSDDDGGNDDSGSVESKSDGVLTIGSLLPKTGNLAFLGPPEIAGVKLAVEEINAAGGVLGQPVEYVEGDSGGNGPGDANIAPEEADKLINADVDAIIGAASSGVSQTVIDKILGAGVIQFSPANTSTAFDEDPFDGEDLYFRTAPSDILQGAVLANLLLQEGKQNVAIISTDDPYGTTLTEEVSKNLEAGGSKLSVDAQFFGSGSDNYDTQVDAIAGSSPDAVVVIAFNETVDIIPSLAAAGVGPADVPTYFVDGNTAEYNDDPADPEDTFLPAGSLVGVKGTIPGAEAPAEFRQRLLGIDPALTDFTYSAESYDATIVTALAALVAETDAADKVAAELPGVTKDGTKCTTFQECADLIAAGEDIDYDGVSGPIELGSTGSPTAASIGIWAYDDQNFISPVEFISGQIPDPSDG
ncbi:ABC transporter substrate-binding protein [Aeromicrobium sp. Leaf350]|uniref:ABC transporter substrate-binding protein n=1 Tax=Aeromicrobium sp. Leaf350 TaxID=2876565 RepID=UPI001E39999E|nr:ABC transporter substrate-binding protein [Aeromicrobium sp. Leaf350]